MFENFRTISKNFKKFIDIQQMFKCFLETSKNFKIPITFKGFQVTQKKFKEF